jgi:hypothetical protein
MGGGANNASLLEAQQNYAEYGASERRFIPFVRLPLAGERRDADWRPINLASDAIEEPIPGKE